jgi:hypothetical protein
MLSGFLAIVIGGLGLWGAVRLGDPFLFAAATALAYAVQALPEALQRMRIETPFYFPGTAEPRFEALRGAIAVLGALAAAAAIGFVALFTFDFEDGRPGGASLGVFAVALLVATLIGGLVATLTGAVAGRFALYRLALVFGVVFSATQLAGEARSPSLAPPTSLAFFESFASRSMFIGDAIEDYIDAMPSMTGRAIRQNSARSAFRAMQGALPDYLCSSKATLENEDGAVVDACAGRAPLAAESRARRADLVAFLGDADRYVDRIIVEVASRKRYEESPFFYRLALTSALAQGVVIAVFAAALLRLLLGR